MRPYQGHFNPRAPCGARRFPLSIFLPEHGEFQPTRPLRGATIKGLSAQVKELFQPTRPLRGATTARPAMCARKIFQPTRPLRGATGLIESGYREIFLFQPTRPLRGATPALTSAIGKLRFQPTRPLRGATFASVLGTCRQPNFNPRAPCGARRD